MTKEELIERLADIEHQRWSDWQRYVHQGGIATGPAHNGGGPLVIPAELVEHWNRLIATPYAHLPEYSKQADRDQVMRYLPLIVAFVAEWLEQASPEDFQYDIPSRVWREEMI